MRSLLAAVIILAASCGSTSDADLGEPPPTTATSTTTTVAPTTTPTTPTSAPRTTTTTLPPTTTTEPATDWLALYEAERSNWAPPVLDVDVTAIDETGNYLVIETTLPAGNMPTTAALTVCQQIQQFLGWDKHLQVFNGNGQMIVTTSMWTDAPVCQPAD